MFSSRSVREVFYVPATASELREGGRIRIILRNNGGFMEKHCGSFEAAGNSTSYVRHCVVLICRHEGKAMRNRCG